MSYLNAIFIAFADKLECQVYATALPYVCDYIILYYIMLD